MKSDRIQIAATLARDVVAAAKAKAKASGQPFSRVLDAAARRGLGLPDMPPILDPASTTSSRT